MPYLGIALSYELISNNAIKFGIIGLLIIPFVFFATRYYLAIPSALLFVDSGGLESSKLLVKGDFWQVLTVLTEIFAEPLPLNVIAIIKIVFLILTGPICGIASTIMYLKLNQIKAVDVLPQKNADQIESLKLVETI